MANVTIVVGGQAGSEGKGLICGHLHRHAHYDLAVRIGGPNAGHSVVDDTGRKWAFRQLPVAAVVDRNTSLVIAAGSEISLPVLVDEIQQADDAGWNVTGRLFVDETATVITDADILLEGGIKTGTTGKGIGGSRANRALRQAQIVDDLSAVAFGGAIICDTQAMVRDPTALILLEGTQGYILGSHAGEYPFSTSGDCRAIDFMAAAGMYPQDATSVVVLRMHPIRIAGNSGPLGNETTWEALGVPPEQTTVTKKVRRVGKWDTEWADRSIRANGGRSDAPALVALTFVDYVFPGLTKVEGPVKLGDLPHRLQAFIHQVEHDSPCRIGWLGTSPNTVIEVYR